MKIVTITGSLRKASFTRMLIDSLPDLAPEGMEIEQVEIGHLPFYNEDLRDGDAAPDAVQAVIDKIAAADGVIFGTPEYNRSFSAVIKNAIDWVSKSPAAPLSGKPTLVATQSPGAAGGLAANHHLRQVLSIVGADLLTGGEIAVGASGQKFENGTLSDAATRSFVTQNLERLADRVRR